MSAKTALEKPSTPVSRERLAILQEASKPAQELILAIDTEFRNHTARNVLGLFKIGAMIEDAVNNEARYGANFVDIAARYTGVKGGTSRFYKLRQIVRAFDHETVQQFSARGMAGGGSLEFGHWYALSRLESPKTRKQMLERTVRESLNVNQLEEVLAAENLLISNPRAAGTGRKNAPPTSPVGGLHRFGKQAESLLRYRRETLGQHVIKPLLEMPADKVSPELLAAVEESQEQARRLVEESEQYVAELARVAARVKAVLEAAAEEEDEDEEDEDAPPPPKVAAATSRAPFPARRSAVGRRAPTPPPTAGKKPAVKKPAAKKPPGKKAEAEPAPEFRRPVPATI